MKIVYAIYCFVKVRIEDLSSSTYL
uniref:Uncharacterized protein n=1 Tax=Arundo donax TaxID=35708 RepID=A0A0A9FDX7_ARUDO